MGKTVPMLSDAKHLRTWDQLEKMSAGRHRKPSEPAFRRVLETVKGLPRTDGALVQRTAEAAFEFFPDKFKQTVLELDGCITQDVPDAVLRISDLLLSNGDITLAESIAARAGDSGDRELSCRVHGRMRMMQGDTEDAADLLVRAWYMDPGDPETYVLLEELEPDYGWQYIRCIERMWDDGVLESPADAPGGAYSELYDCCCAWNSGRRTDAVTAMQSCARFRTDSYHQIVYARMCLATGVYANAADAYRSALEMSPGCVFAMCEAASAMRLIGDYQKAIGMCRSALEIHPGCRTALEQLILSASESGRKHETDGYISRYLDLPPEDASAYAFCASVLRDTGFPMEATSLIRRLEARCSDRSYAYLQMSVDEARNGDWKKAVTDAVRAKKLAPDSIECICQCAKAYLGADNRKLAEKEAEAALALQQNSVSALSVKKDVLISRGEFDQALELMDRIVALVPRDASIRKDRGDLLMSMGRDAEAMDSYREALNVRDDLRLFISIILKMLKERRIPDLCRLVDDYDDIYGESPEVWMIRGNGEYLAGMYAEAAESYASASTLSYDDPVIWHSKGMAEQQSGDLISAQASFDRAIIQDLDNPDYWISKALVQEQIGDVSGAVDSVNKVIALAPENLFALVLKARLLVSSGMYDEALFFLDLALRIMPNDLRVHSLKKDLLMHIRRYDEAVRVCDAAIRMDDGDLQMKVDRAMALLGAGRAEEAVSSMNDLHNRYKNEYAVMRGEARFYASLTEYERSADIYEHILEIRPDDDASAEELSDVYRAMGMEERADAVDPRKRRGSVSAFVEEPEEEPPAVEEQVHDTGPADRSDAGLSEERRLEALMDSDDSSPEPFLEYIGLLLVRGDTEGALNAAMRARSLFSSDPRVVTVLADICRSTGDLRSALTYYGEAAELGVSDPEMFLSKGDTEYDLALYQPAMESYMRVVRQDPVSRDGIMGMCRVHMKNSQRDLAAPLLDSVLTRDPSDTEALKMRTEIYVWHNDAEGVLSLYPSIVENVTDPADLQFFSDSLISVGEERRAETLFSSCGKASCPEDVPSEDAPVQQADGARDPPAPRMDAPLMEADGSMGHIERTDDELEAMAVSVLARSADTGLEADDPELYAGLDSWDAEGVRRFFRTAQPYPFINPGDDFFDEMESTSYDIIIGERIDDLESQPVVSLELVYRHCVHKDMEYVRRMQAYINHAVTGDYDPIPFSKEVDRLMSDVRMKGMSVYEIMKESGAGVYTAVTVSRLSRQ